MFAPSNNSPYPSRAGVDMPAQPVPNPAAAETGISLYLHVPFCQTKCPYCDFNTYQGIESLMAPYLDALATDLELWGRTLNHPTINTIFFGGGTPSYLPAGAIGRLLAAVGANFPVASDAEITIEANPGDITSPLGESLLRAGVNRISFGVQSLDDRLLQLLGRRHDARQAHEAYQAARAAGLDNISLDLMYGLPQQSAEQWNDTVARLVSWQPEHVSLYCLTLEEGTPLHRWVAQGRLSEPDPDLAADMYHHAEDILAQAGYRHYEISNWTLPGRESRHNMAYWLNLPYLGVGPGAHSRLGCHRFWTVNSPRDYIHRVNQWAAVDPNPAIAVTWGRADGEAASPETVPTIEGSEFIGPELAAAETMFLGLRLLDGMDLPAASRRAGANLLEKYREQVDDLVALGLLERQDDTLRLTPTAYLIANQVFTRFLE